MGLDEIRSSFFRRNRSAELLDTIFRTPENPTPMFFMDQIREHADLKRVDFALMRLGSNIEKRFAIDGEVAVFFAPWKDFQRRSYKAINEDVRNISRRLQEQTSGTARFDPNSSLAILVSGDPGAPRKLTEWARDAEGPTTLAPIAPTELLNEPDVALELLLQKIRDKLGARDLYRAQNPVTGADFFGRTAVISDLAARIAGKENLAIFGVRRSGKTSVIRELKRTLAPRGVAVAISDMEMVSRTALSNVSANVIRALVETLRDLKRTLPRVTVGGDLSQLPETMSFSELSDWVRRVANRNPDLHIVLAVDEVEHLGSISKSDPEAVRLFLGALRSTAQANPNVSLLFSGVANTMFLSSSIGEGDQRSDNPVFGQVSPIFLKPFDETETHSLLTTIGRPMFLEWSTDASRMVHDLSGGSPFFVRELASAVSRHLETSGNRFGQTATVTNEVVTTVSMDWRSGAAHFWSEVLAALELHYPDAAYLLSPDVTELTLNEWVNGSPALQEAANGLVDLGLFNGTSGDLTFTESLRALRSLAEPETPQRTFAPADERQLIELSTMPESQHLEFKSTARFDLRTEKAEKHISDSIVKTVVGFANAEGGVLLIGVADDGTILGIQNDLAIFQGSMDRFERWLSDLLTDSMGHTFFGSCVAVTFPMVRGKQLVHVLIEPSTEPVLAHDKDLYVRVGNQTKRLEGRPMVDFVRTRGA